jgi:GTPase
MGETMSISSAVAVRVSSPAPVAAVPSSAERMPIVITGHVDHGKSTNDGALPRTSVRSQLGGR